LKKLLIIQLDEAYFLFETLLVIDQFREELKNFSLTLLVNKEALSNVQDGSCPLPSNITTSLDNVLMDTFDVSVNLSLSDKSWTIHNEIESAKKLGPYKKEGQLLVEDPWSSFLLTLRGGAPFLSFHLQDIYKNILGFRSFPRPREEKKQIQKIAIGLCNTQFFSSHEQEQFIKLLNNKYPRTQIVDVLEIDTVSDMRQVLYIGPANLSSLKLCEGGGLGLFLSRQFQGLNLLPHGDGHYFISSNNKQLKALDLIRFIDQVIITDGDSGTLPFSVYQITEENLFGSYLKSLNGSDDQYPIYQSHVVLWNFLLNLFDVTLDIIKCSPDQEKLLNEQKEVLLKIIRLYDYALSSIEIINQEAKAASTDSKILLGHMNNLEDIEKVTDQISRSHIYLRPILDYYRIRRGQNNGVNLIEQAQHSLLAYSEEQQALKGLMELFTVTLSKNEVSI
jgi:hypothetical protein